MDVTREKEQRAQQATQAVADHCTLCSTGFPEVGVTPLIAHISLMPGPITKSFDSMKVKTGRFFLVYDK